MVLCRIDVWHAADDSVTTDLIQCISDQAAAHVVFPMHRNIESPMRGSNFLHGFFIILLRMPSPRPGLSAHCVGNSWAWPLSVLPMGG